MADLNAGISRTEDMASGEWDVSAAQAMVDTNIMGVLRVTAAVLPVLKLQSDATILATSSALAFVPEQISQYCASKASLHSWLTSLQHQLRTIPVEVLSLSPPYVQTELTGTAQASDPRHAAGRLRVGGVCGCWTQGTIPAANCCWSVTTLAAGPKGTVAATTCSAS